MRALSLQKEKKEDEGTDEFEILLEENRSAAERYVRYRINSAADADDVLQETYIAAFLGFERLRNRASFKAWLISIAKNKCTDYYRKRRNEAVPEAITGSVPALSRFGLTRQSAVIDTIDRLGKNDREVLMLYYFADMKQSEIAQKLDIPLGTVKSRLNTARENFRNQYPYPEKGDTTMKKLPETMPEYRIIPEDKPPFTVKWEELMGWFIVPRQGEKLCWAMYDFSERKRGEYVELEVCGAAEIHGIEGVMIRSREYDVMPCNKTDNTEYAERTFIAQLTDTHCRFLAESHTENGVKRLHTFLDADAFLPNWGFGEDNCGNETHIGAKGDIIRNGGCITAKNKPFLLDAVGRYTVEICGRRYDTICVIDIETYNEGVMSEQYLDRNGRTILWRRFNRGDWNVRPGDLPWTERLKGNETVTVNGQIYVHWYDCLTDYVM